MSGRSNYLARLEVETFAGDPRAQHVLGVRDRTVAKIQTEVSAKKRRKIIDRIERRVRRNPQPNRGAFARAVLRDEQGRRYLLPDADDALLEDYRQTRDLHGRLDRAAPRETSARDARGTSGLPLRDVLLYVALPRGADNPPAPPDPRNRETVQLLDSTNGTVYSATVDQAYFDRGRKTGHVLLTDVHEWGQMADPTEFGRPD